MGQRRIVLGLAVCGLVAAAGGCAESQPVEYVLRPDAGSSAGGGSASGGSNNPGTGGVRASGGDGGDGAGGASGAGGAAPAPTFAAIYQSILGVSCIGSDCHKPGTQGGVSFASTASAYKAIFPRVIPGDAEGSGFYVTVSTGQMPPIGDILTSAQLAQLAAWIDAGAAND